MVTRHSVQLKYTVYTRAWYKPVAVPLNERKCRTCMKCLEDKIHVLLVYTSYNCLKKLYIYILKPFYFDLVCPCALLYTVNLFICNCIYIGRIYVCIVPETGRHFCPLYFEINSWNSRFWIAIKYTKTNNNGQNTNNNQEYIEPRK